MEPMAARVHPQNVRSAHQSMHHLMADADWSDQALLAAVAAQVLPTLNSKSAACHWIVDDTGFFKEGGAFGRRPPSLSSTLVWSPIPYPEEIGREEAFFSEEQIIGFLREAEAGMPIKDLCRRHGFSEASYYLWRSKFGGMSVPDAKRLQDLEAENTRLKKLLAEQVFQNDLIEDALQKNNGERTGASCAGARVDRRWRQRALRPGSDRHERQCAALSPARGPQR